MEFLTESDKNVPKLDSSHDWTALGVYEMPPYQTHLKSEL